MSKNLTRKGLAFGAGIALVVSGLAGAPAQADTTGPITLVPTAGTTFNSILQSGISLQSEIDPSTTIAKATSLSFLITNLGAKSVTAKFAGKAVGDNTGAGAKDSLVGSLGKQIVIDSDVDPSTTALAAVRFSGAGSPSSTQTTVSTQAASTKKYIYVTGAGNGADLAAMDAGALLNLGGTGAANTLTLSSAATTTTTLTVQSWLDENGNGRIDTFEPSSDPETVILYAASDVSAVTTVDAIVVGSPNYKATVVYGNGVNPHMVAADTGVQILFNGAVRALDATDQVGTTQIQDGNISLVTRTAGLGITKDVITMGPAIADGAAEDVLDGNAVAGIYSAIAFYNTSGAQTFLTAANVRMGAPSAILDISAGNNASVDKLTLDVTDTANYKETATDANEIYVRTGTKSVTFGVQARDATVVLKAANIDVRAIVTETALDAAAEITISGSTGKLVDGGAAIIAYGVTDSNGQASFTVTSKNGKKNEAIDVAIQFKISTGVWTTINAKAAGGVDAGLDIKWFDTAFSAFTPKPAAFVSGANPVVTFKVTDQWSQPVSFIDDTRLSVYASAYVGGVENSTKYAERVTVVDGVAAFTFANFAAAGATAELRGILYKGAENNIATSNVIVYNTAATSAINVATSFKTDITYNDYVTGSSTDTTVAAALAATGLGADTVSATIAGNVNNTTGSGQPGAAVTLSADGVLFFDSAAKVYALDTITTTSNEYGAWTVSAYSHTVNTKGAIVSITSGTVTASTKLITYLPKDLLTRDNLVFSFDVPATLVMNTTYVVVAKLADKWGNPVQTSGDSGSVSVVGNGSVQVNGVTAATVKDFDVKGESTVFVRSLKDIAGPSSVSATLLAVDSQYPIDPDVNGGANGELGLDSFGTLLSTTIDVTGTAWDETTFDKVIATERDVLETAPVVVSDTKVNVGTFKGYVALYAKGYKGQKMSAIVAGKWIVIPTLASDFERVVRFTGAGYTITTKLYIDGEQVGDAFTTLTK